MPAPSAALGASFRDPSGFVFRHDGVVYRQVEAAYAPHYEKLMQSGLYDALAADGLLLPHEEVPAPAGGGGWKTLRPRQLPFVSHPYEWSFGQFKDAALLTLKLHARALDHGMVLKDASAFNVQFVEGRPVFIDTLSFESRVEGAPWIAYGQFCRHFLAPLALMARVDVRLSRLLALHLDGVPLDLAARLLPWGTRFNPSLGLHLHLHARLVSRHAAPREGSAAPKVASIGLQSLKAMADSLLSAVEGLSWRPGGTEWFDYYRANNNYGEAGLEEKERAVREALARCAPKTVWDLGGNTGRFSRLAAAAGADAVCWDIDPSCVEANWQHVKQHHESRVLPLWLDLTNPSPALGWAHAEREALAARGPADLAMALGLVHHLAIGNNVPLARVCEWFARLSRWLLVEFVPKDDSQVRKLLASRADVFPDYTAEGFERALGATHEIVSRVPLAGTVRTVYLARKR